MDLFLQSVLVIYMSIFMPVPHCFDYYSFVVQLETGKCDASGFAPLTKGCFGYLESYVAPYRFEDWLFYICENATGILVGIASNLLIALNNKGILIILILPIYEHRIFFHSFVPSISFIKGWQFSAWRSCISLITFITDDFTALVVLSVGLFSLFLFHMFCYWYTEIHLFSEC